MHWQAIFEWSSMATDHSALAPITEKLRWSCRRQGRYKQCEKPAPVFAGAGVPS